MIGLKTLVVVAGLLLTTTATDAADKKAKKANKAADKTTALFKKLDTNNDGKLSSAEFAKLAEVKKALKAANPKKKKKAGQGEEGEQGCQAQEGREEGREEGRQIGGAVQETRHEQRRLAEFDRVRETEGSEEDRKGCQPEEKEESQEVIAA